MISKRIGRNGVLHHGTGDVFAPLPDELLESLGWKEGDKLKLEVTDGNIKLSLV